MILTALLTLTHTQSAANKCSNLACFVVSFLCIFCCLFWVFLSVTVQLIPGKTVSTWPCDQYTPGITLALPYRITYKLCLLMHLIHTVQAPSYLTDIVIQTATVSSRSLFGPPTAYDMNSHVRDYETETRSTGFFLRCTSCMEHSSNVVAANFWHRNF